MNSVRLIREHFKLSQRDVAEMLGFCDRQVISNMEREEKDRLTVDQIRKIKSAIEAQGREWPSGLMAELLKPPIGKAQPTLGRPRKNQEVEA